MKHLLVILFIIISFLSSGQTCDTINGRLINCVDSLGRRQGKWETLKKTIVSGSYSGYGNKDGCQYIENSVWQPIVIGQYKDNKKVGIWEYIVWEGYDNSWVEKNITYYDNGSIIESNRSYNSVIEFNKDSSVVEGFTIHDRDSIYITCTNKMCVFKLNSDKKIISFQYTDYEKFEYELLCLTLGIYNREIMKTKTNR